VLSSSNTKQLTLTQLMMRPAVVKFQAITKEK